ncbi:uncharacterized protein LOC134260337 [Saccostrea cucullata]|uniref:uncharacterized protein LOC134260337 n=1 Tax=Saccostrea cuccullata TaxID=36930 RepID=UPI002ED62727
MSDKGSETSRETILDFGVEPVENIDAKLAILKFTYSWADEVEKEERLTEEILAKKEALIQREVTVLNNLIPDEGSKIRETILDFGEEPVKNIDAKLDILKFSYSWAKEVEEHERRIKEAKSQTVKSEENMEKTAQKTIAKMESKEDQAKRTGKDQDILPKDMALQKTELLINNKEQEKTKQDCKGLSMDKALENIDQFQDFCPRDTTQKTEQLLKRFSVDKIQEKKEQFGFVSEDKAQAKIDGNFSIPQELLNFKKSETETKVDELEVHQNGRQSSDLQPLVNDNVENEDHFIPRRLFLFGITEFKTDETRYRLIETTIETHSAPNAVNDLPPPPTFTSEERKKLLSEEKAQEKTEQLQKLPLGDKALEMSEQPQKLLSEDKAQERTEQPQKLLSEDKAQEKSEL